MRSYRLGMLVFFCAIFSAFAGAQQAIESITLNGAVRVPRLSKPPAIEDFVSMHPSRDFADGKMAKVTGFLQRNPTDGAPGTQNTEVYLGYDAQNLYAVFVCFDSEPKKIRARLSKREDAGGDENAEIMLDTFSDQRRAYGFMSNPLGVQSDAMWSESQGWDFSFDTVWYSKGKLTDQGYVVWMAIPFRSLRFPSGPQQNWGLLLNRDIRRDNEETYWPHYTAKIEGRMNQAGRLEGLESISPGRNMQFTPHASFRSFRAPDLRDETAPRFESRTLKSEFGLDSKIVIKDSFVLDATVKPDFSQVESDEAQVTANRRFETFFPERRPFFIENSSYFNTPITLVFTRRIAEPDFGVRLTGKKGPYSLGILAADDRSPGKSLIDGDPLVDSRAYFGVARVQRDIGTQSTIGLIYTDREYLGEFNRVGGVDGRFKLNENWVGTFQAVTSSTQFTDGTTQAGPAYTASIKRSGRKFNYNANFNDTGSGFLAQTGFFRRPDYRSFNHNFNYSFRPEGKRLISHGPYFGISRGYDHDGVRLNSYQSASYNLNFKGQNHLEAGFGAGSEGLRPSDYASITQNTEYSTDNKYLYFESNYFSKAGFNISLEESHNPSYIGIGLDDAPPVGQPPRTVLDRTLQAGFTLRPTSQLRISNRYNWEQFFDERADQSQLDMHIVRSSWNYQFNRELSLRFIGQYQAGLANTDLSFLKTTKQFNADFLLTYLLHPGTALYVGYNSNLANLDPSLRMDANGDLLRPRNQLINDSRQFFIKLSYQFRY
ncbi:MAG TPA: DUF5916 domain-containing protein [Clostridia bacterium]|nr:DUF5916 domain-containing protein [Clostridia bacterium]